MSTGPLARADLFRLLGDEDRLRLLALCDADELTVGELAELLAESQPQITRKTQALRDAGLLRSRRDGTRTLLRAETSDDGVVAAALEAGRALCLSDGTLANVPRVIAHREDRSRAWFATPPSAAPPGELRGSGEFAANGLLLQALAALFPRRALAVDVGTGDGAGLTVLSPLFERVVAVDRSAARLAQAAARIASLALPNVRLREADADDGDLRQEVEHLGGADLVLLSRVLCHAAAPRDVVSAAGRLLRPAGHIVIIDHVQHDDEAMREAGHVWLGFSPTSMQSFLSWGGLSFLSTTPLRDGGRPPLFTVLGQRPA